MTGKDWKSARGIRGERGWETHAAGVVELRLPPPRLDEDVGVKLLLHRLDLADFQKHDAHMNGHLQQ